jgi:tetratricopeptide (TPR) repeat protein
VARPRGLLLNALEAEINLAYYHADAGRFRDALSVIGALEPSVAESGAGMILMDVRSIRARIAVMTGAPVVIGDVAWLEEFGTETRGDPEHEINAFGTAALARHSLGEETAATSLLETLADVDWLTNGFWAPRLLPALARLAMTIGRADLLARLGSRDDASHPLAKHAAMVRGATLLEMAGDAAAGSGQYAAAVAGYAAMGMRPEEAYAQLGQGRCLVSLGRTDEAARILEQARATFEALGMAPALSEVELLVPSAASARS